MAYFFKYQMSAILLSYSTCTAEIPEKATTMSYGLTALFDAVLGSNTNIPAHMNDYQRAKMRRSGADEGMVYSRSRDYPEIWHCREGYL